MTDNETENLYLKYSSDRGKKSNSVYNIEKSFGRYSFIHVNATLVPGPKRPYNFLGLFFFYLHPKFYIIHVS